MKKVTLTLEVDDVFAELIAKHFARGEVFNFQLPKNSDGPADPTLLYDVPVIGLTMVGQDAFGHWSTL